MLRHLHNSRVGFVKFRSDLHKGTGSGIRLFQSPKPCLRFRFHRRMRPLGWNSWQSEPREEITSTIETSWQRKGNVSLGIYFESRKWQSFSESISTKFPPCDSTIEATSKLRKSWLSLQFRPLCFPSSNCNGATVASRAPTTIQILVFHFLQLQFIHQTWITLKLVLGLIRRLQICIGGFELQPSTACYCTLCLWC